MTTAAADKLVAVAQQLRAGQSPRQVAEALGLSEDDVRAIARDIPGLTPARPAPTAIPRAAATSAIHTPSTPPAALVTSPAPAPVGSPIARLLEDASQHSKPAVRTLASRIERNLDQLRALIAEHQATEAARRAEAEAKEKAKAEVARLEKQLADAKARLRSNRPAPARTASTPRPEGGFPCRKCSKPIATPQGRGNHEKHCTAGAA